MDAERIGVLGVCGGGGYAVNATLTEKRIKAGAFGAYRDGMEIYGRATASRDRRLVSLEDWSHYDLYDKSEPVGKALAKLVPFFKEHLG